MSTRKITVHVYIRYYFNDSKVLLGIGFNGSKDSNDISNDISFDLSFLNTCFISSSLK